jgi:hypothetical protein
MLNKLEKRIKHSGKNCKTEDLVQVMDIVGNLNTTYLKNNLGDIIFRKSFECGNEKIELERVLNANGEVQNEQLIIQSVGGTRMFAPTNRFTEVQNAIKKLFMYFLINKDILIEITKEMDKAHAIHMKHAKAAFVRKQTHENMRKGVLDF